MEQTRKKFIDFQLEQRRMNRQSRYFNNTRMKIMTKEQELSFMITNLNNKLKELESFFHEIEIQSIILNFELSNKIKIYLKEIKEILLVKGKLLKKNISTLNFEFLLFTFLKSNFDEEILIYVLEISNLILLQTENHQHDDMLNGDSFFEKLMQICQTIFFNNSKFSILFEKSIFLIGNLICKKNNLVNCLDLKSILEKSFEWINYKEFFQIYDKLIWLLRIIIAFCFNSNFKGSFINELTSASRID